MNAIIGVNKSMQLRAGTCILSSIFQKRTHVLSGLRRNLVTE